MRRNSSCMALRSFRSSARQRLVEQQHRRPHHQRAGQRDALLLPAREILHRPVGELFEMDELQDLLTRRLGLGRRRCAASFRP